MSDYRFGFTGTRQGMTDAQKTALRDYLTGGTGEFHHGDCIGADAESHDIAEACGYRIVLHPPSDPALRAWRQVRVTQDIRPMQQHFDLIPHPVQGGIIYQRPKDGYINATAMCQAAGKRWNDYSSIGPTAEFLKALTAETGIPVSDMVQSQRGGDVRFQGTWVHPQVAINLAQWLSGEFAVKVSQWVYDWMLGAGPATVRETVPYHLRRYIANQPNIPVAHFSILAEMTTLLIGPMELMGYTLPEHMLPDISQGKMFCKWLRDVHGIDTKALPTYLHVFEDGRRVWPKAYPDQLLPEFRRHFREEWLPHRSIEYFRGRDSEALQFLPKLITANKPKRLN